MKSNDVSAFCEVQPLAIAQHCAVCAQTGSSLRLALERFSFRRNRLSMWLMSVLSVRRTAWAPVHPKHSKALDARCRSRSAAHPPEAGGARNSVSIILQFRSGMSRARFAFHAPRTGPEACNRFLRFGSGWNQRTQPGAVATPASRCRDPVYRSCDGSAYWPISAAQKVWQAFGQSKPRTRNPRTAPEWIAHRLSTLFTNRTTAEPNESDPA